MKNIVIAAAVIFLGAIMVKVMTRPTLKYFTSSEFGIWWLMMNADLLLKLDAFREAWGYPVNISGNKKALGRYGGDDSHSQHNFDMWGEVNAADFFPQVPNGQGGYRGIATLAERQRAERIARQVGFTGIGIYTDTKAGNMVHGDVRKPKRPGYVATWSRVNGEFLGIEEVLA